MANGERRMAQSRLRAVMYYKISFACFSPAKRRVGSARVAPTKRYREVYFETVNGLFSWRGAGFVLLLAAMWRDCNASDLNIPLILKHCAVLTE